MKNNFLKIFVWVMMLFFVVFSTSSSFAASGRSKKYNSSRRATTPLTEWVKIYSNQGYHRSGSSEDEKSAQWLKSVLSYSDIPVTLETFSFERPVTKAARLVLETKPRSRELSGMPLFNAASTDVNGYSGRLGTIHEVQEVPVIYRFEIMPNEQMSPQFLTQNHSNLEKILNSNTHPAVIVITQGDRVGLAPFDINLLHSYNIPVMLISSNYGDDLEMLTHINTPFEMTTVVKKEPVTAYNVVAKINGSDPQLKPIVVLTDRSTWWKGAGEHGTGLAAWLYTARKLRFQHPRRAVYFIALTGHELGDLGLKEFQKNHPELINNSRAWIVLGANIAASSQPVYGLYSSDNNLGHQVEEIFSRYQIMNLSTLSQPSHAVGLSENVENNQGSFLDFEGLTNGCYHLECDKWPGVVNSSAETQFAQAFSEWVVELSRT